MKKIISIAMALVMSCLLLVGCGAKEVNLSEAMTKINSDFSLSLKTLDSVDDLNTYYSIDTADVKQFAAEIDPNNDAPVEIVLVEAVDAEAATRIETALTTRYNDIYGRYSSYTPEKLDMVKSCKVTNENNIITLIVADKGSEILSAFNESIK